LLRITIYRGLRSSDSWAQKRAQYIYDDVRQETQVSNLVTMPYAVYDLYTHKSYFAAVALQKKTQAKISP